MESQYHQNQILLQQSTSSHQQHNQQNYNKQQYFINNNNNNSRNNICRNNNNNNNSIRYNQQQQQQYNNQLTNNGYHYNNQNNTQILEDSSLLREKLNKLNLSSNMDNNHINKNNNRLVNTPSTQIKNDQPIWKSFIYDPNTSIYLIKREKLDRKYLLNKDYLNNISLKTNTKINFYSNGDLNENNTTVYFTVSGSYDSRCNALEMLREETGKAGVIINLPSLVNNDNRRQQQPQQQQQQQQQQHLKSSLNRHFNPVKKQCSFANDDLKTDINNNNNNNINSNTPAVTVKRTKSFQNKFELDRPLSSYIDNNNYNNQSISQSPSISSTSSIASSSSSNNNNNNNNNRRKFSHGSSLIPSEYNNNNNNNDKNNNMTITKNNTVKSINKQAKRYDINFLLSRADALESKQLPKDWPELNMKYPNICFCGRVISYFNPHKYQAYWIKIKQLNQHLHI